MQIVDWNRADAAARARVLQRPARNAANNVRAGVERLIAQVRADGDHALRLLTRRFDGIEIGALEVADAEFTAAEAQLDGTLKAAMARAAERIRRFHEATAPQAVRVEIAPGVQCERVLRPIQRVGLYAPAGSAPLPSTVLMLAIPAQLAGCPDVVLCTPPGADGACDAAILYAARQCGVRRVFRLGGAQAIAAMALGTASVPRCQKLFGPGNPWVTEAKQQVAALPDGPAIDMPAGPSEVLVIADDAADPRLLAADLLSQAEHGADSQVLLVSPDRATIERTLQEIERQCADLPRVALARQSLGASHAVCVRDLAEAIALSNDYAPEHLILQVREARALLPEVHSAGSVFLGAWSPESVGDYGSGTNHVLPTDGHARAWSGVSVASFLKQITVQELDANGLRGIGPDTVVLARAERLEAHARAVTLRLVALAGAP